MKGPTARDVAARVLVRVVRDESFAAAALEAELGRAVQLEPRDRALATELVYGTLRVLPWIIAELDARAKKPTSGLPWEARGALWVAMQQIQFMRVPAFAAVDEAVSAVRRAAGPRVAGFANALLRRAAEARAKIATDAEANELRARAVRESCPRDMRDALAAALGEEDAARFLEETETPPMGLRVRDAASREGVMKKLAAARPNAELHEGRVSPLCILARGLGKPQTLDEFRSGEISIQEEGSQAIALSVDAKKDERVLDACAGRGNKTAVLASSGANVDACDLDPRKLEALRADLARLGLAPNATFAVDWTVGSGDVRGTYDAILVDAPCSGIGTLRRRPELALRARTPLEERTKTQRAIALGALKHLAPGGRFVYAVCSVLREECEDVVSALPLEIVTSRRLLPYVGGTDGYYVSILRQGR
jgi:16S rRNA (cytosine967-C5)-methyltransferase